MLAYNQVHFEGLVPDTPSDLEKTIQLKNQYINNEYHIQKKDMPMFADQQATYAQAAKRAPTAQLTSSFSPSTSKKTNLRPKPSTQVVAQGYSKSRSPPSDGQPHKKIKDMSVEEKREYKRIKEKQRREKMEESKKEKMKENDRNRKEVKRSDERGKDETGFKRKRADEKSIEREKARGGNEVVFKRTRAEEKAKGRNTARQEDEQALRSKWAEEKAKGRLKEVSSEEKRRKKFIDSIKKGRIFECVSCHRKCFENGVSPLPENFEHEFENEECYPDV